MRPWGKVTAPQNYRDRQADTENHSLLSRNPGAATSMETSVGVQKSELYVKNHRRLNVDKSER